MSAPAVPAPSPLFVRVARGDVVDVHASLVAVGHVNDVAPTGAERAVDALLGGAISRRGAQLRGRLGTTHFLPTLASPLAAGAVLVVCLGDAETFTLEQVDQVGAALVDAAAAIGVRDVATVVHGGGTEGADVRQLACRLLSGVLGAVRHVEGAGVLRELTIVERDPDRFAAVHAGVQDAVTVPSVHVYVSDLEVRRTVAGATPVEGGTPAHLRLGITRAGPDLKVTRIGDDAFDRAFVAPYPADVSTSLPVNLARQVLLERDEAARAGQLASVGSQLFEAFLGDPQLGAAALLDGAPGELLVLRLDGWTADLPWELARLPDGRVLGRDFRLARQLELGSVGRSASFVDPHEPLTALVVGNSTGRLPGAAEEAREVAKALRDRAGADVELLCGKVTYAALSEQLDARPWDVLHYAGHARFVEGRPEESGLALADTLLTPGDLATRRWVPRLVVANACHSAATRKPYAGAPETRTLVSGLLGAGARAFLGAMWQVRDDVAVTFASAFYAAVAPVGDGPEPVGEAVRQARAAVVAEHGEGEPGWAAYALYGSPWRRAV